MPKYFTPWVDGATHFEDSEMNAPLEEIDHALDTHVHQAYYLLGGYWPSVPNADDIILAHVFTDIGCVFPAGMADSELYAWDAATASTELSIQKNGVEFATITVGIGGQTGTFACASATSFGQNDRLTVVAPNPMDATLGRIAITLKAGRKSQTAQTTTTTTSSSTTSSTISTTTTTA